MPMVPLEELLRMPRPSQRAWSWRRLTTGDTLLHALREAVQQGSIGAAEARLHTWHVFIDHEDGRGYEWQWHKAWALLACAQPALAARGLEHKLAAMPNPPHDWPVDVLFPLLHAAAETASLSCNHDVDHGKLRMALMAQSWFGVEESPRSAALPLYAQVVDCVFRFLADNTLPPASPERLSWVWDVTRTLLGQPRHAVCIRKIPVAGTEGSPGFLATLTLEVLEPGCGAVFHDPHDAFCTRADAAFVAAMQDAWRGARLLIQTQAQEQTPPQEQDRQTQEPNRQAQSQAREPDRQAQTQAAKLPQWDGRWRLLRGGGPAAEANDRSASGAAARGWWFALTDKVPDEGVIVVAQVDENDVTQLKGVDDVGVVAKTKAIAADGRFDTIVVATATNQREAEAALREVGKLGPIRVVNLDDGNA